MNYMPYDMNSAQRTRLSPGPGKILKENGLPPSLCREEEEEEEKEESEEQEEEEEEEDLTAPADSHLSASGGWWGL
jgi:hypothetical protein